MKVIMQKQMVEAPGDIEGAGIRLTRKQVKQLVRELKKWLRRGY